MNVLDDISRSNLSFEFRRFRPPRSISVKMDPRGWFQYAAKCVIDVIHRKRSLWSWEYMAKRRDQRRAYIDLYTKLRNETIILDELEDLEDLEWELEYDEIRFYRHLATKKMGQLKPVQEQPAATSSWYGWITGKDTTTETKEWDQQLQKLYEQFEFEDYRASQANYPTNYVKYKISSHLQKGSICLRNVSDGTKNDLVISEYDNLRIDYQAYTGGFKSSFKMQDLKLLNPGDADHPILVESKLPANSEIM